MIIEVKRADLHEVRCVTASPSALDEGDARLRVDAFGLTANNITYAAFGDAMQYWSFFPAADAWGRIPVWGFGEVVETRAPGVEVGQRVYGYFPMADELVVTPGKVGPHGFADVAPHRQRMAAGYNRYVATGTDSIWDAAREPQQMVLWPLFFTSFVIDDFIADNDGFAASAVILSSASSKTAIGAAWLLHERGGARVVGLTSARNRAFVEGLGCYDQVVLYGDVDGLEPVDAVFVDIAGNRDVLTAVHRRFDGHLAHSMQVGGTHWDHQAEESGDAPLPGPAPQFFFAPTQIAKRAKDWGQDELDRRVGAAWHRYSGWTDTWLELRPVSGPDEVTAAYHELLEGRVEPQVGYACSMV